MANTCRRCGQGFQPEDSISSRLCRKCVAATKYTPPKRQPPVVRKSTKPSEE